MDAFEYVLDYCMRIVPDIQTLALSLFDWFTETYTFVGVEISVYEFILGGGLTLILDFAIIKFFTDIIL